MRFGLVWGVLWVSTVGYLSPTAAAAPSDTDPYSAILAEQAIQPELTGIVGYLKGLGPSPENRKLIDSLILQLGHADFAKRELAVRQLVALPVVPVDDLRDAAGSEDGEIRLRAQQVLAARSAGNASSAVAIACFRTIAKKRLIGAAPALLEVLPLYPEEFVLAAGREALKVTSRPQDATLLRHTARTGPLEARVAATLALAIAAGDDARGDLAGLLSDPEARVRLAAARALADRGDRACLGPLVDLLSATDMRVRHGSIATLRALTGRPSTFAAWVDPHTQDDALRAWQEWLASEGQSAQLKYPLRTAEAEMGRTLICLYAKNEIVELDAAGQQIFSVSESGGCPWACQGLANGGRLVALYSSNTLVEYRADGKERVRITVPAGPMSVQRLDNGNTLVAANNAQSVAEVNDSGKVIWEVSLAGGPCDAVRLDNGHTLVTLQNANSVVEIDSSGKEIWKVEGLHTPRSASRLENGNTLVCDLGSGKVIEFDPAANQVWSQGNFSSPFSAQRLSTGTTVVSDTAAVKEIDREGKMVGETKMQSLGRVWRY
jgi:outer membrane protein assembly factor BamB